MGFSFWYVSFVIKWTLCYVINKMSEYKREIQKPFKFENYYREAEQWRSTYFQPNCLVIFCFCECSLANEKCTQWIGMFVELFKMKVTSYHRVTFAQFYIFWLPFKAAVLFKGLDSDITNIFLGEECQFYSEICAQGKFGQKGWNENLGRINKNPATEAQQMYTDLEQYRKKAWEGSISNTCWLKHHIL